MTQITRVEVIDHRPNGEGRVFVERDDEMSAEMSIQDSGRTLKVFLKKK